MPEHVVPVGVGGEPAHRVEPEGALAFGFVLGAISFFYLSVAVNVLAASLALSAIGVDLTRLPRSLRILLENLLRTDELTFSLFSTTAGPSPSERRYTRLSDAAAASSISAAGG